MCETSKVEGGGERRSWHVNKGSSLLPPPSSSSSSSYSTSRLYRWPLFLELGRGNEGRKERRKEEEEEEEEEDKEEEEENVKEATIAIAD